MIVFQYFGSGGVDMKTSVFLAIVLFVAVGIASAAPLCVNDGTMVSYIALGNGGCSIGDLLFYGFRYTDSGSAPASAVFLTPISSSLTSSGPGLSFASSDWTATGTLLSGDIVHDSAMFFNVKTLDGRPLINGATLALVSSEFTGDSGGSVAEGITPGANQLEVDTGGPYLSGVVFAPTSGIQVRKDLFVVGSLGTASIGVFDEGFAVVPEPVGSVLIGSGLLALGIWRRRVSRG
jgi:hypothetical protein